MAAIGYIVQTERGNTLAQFATAHELESYIYSRQLQIVARQRMAKMPSSIGFSAINWREYPLEMQEIEYDEVYIVRNAWEYLIRSDFAEFERRAMIMGNSTIYPDEKVSLDKEEKEKAHKLLLDCLNEQEKEELESFETVTIHTEIGLFRIKMENFWHSIPPSFNAIYKGKRYCAVIKESEKYPRADHFIAQILLIRTDPKKFLALANKG